MEKETIELIDTAIKIGLGAVIAGLSTYVATITKYKKEQLKDKRDKTIQLIETIALKINEIDGILSEVAHQSWDFMTKPDDIIFSDISKNIMTLCVSADKKIGHAQSLAHLIEAESVVKSLDKIKISNQNLFKAFAHGNSYGAQESSAMIDVKEKMDANLDKIFNGLSQAYKNA